MSGSRVLRYRSDSWEGVTPQAYREGSGTHRGVQRHSLVVGTAEDEGLSFETRFFQLVPGGRTSLERHAHSHTVVVLKGRGRVRLGKRQEALVPFDVVFVAPREVHQFLADDDAELGFICIVDRDRDTPEAVDPRTQEFSP